MSINVKEKINQYHDYLIQTRRYLHENPELSGEEVETAAFLKKEVKKLGLEVQQASTTGFIAIFDTGREGKIIGLRTDIDALPVKECPQNLLKDKAVLSKVMGKMHACGHDGHMAMLLTTMKILVDEKENLNGKIIFIFEEGEETNCGINEMIGKLKEFKIDGIFGIHVAAFLETGKVCVDPGAVMAGAIWLQMTVNGKSGHGSRPDLAINPIFAGAAILNGWTSAWANQIDVTKTVTLGIGQFHSGTINNVLPSEAQIGGTLRYFNVEEGKKAFEIINKVAKLTAEAHNCSVMPDSTQRIATMPVVNDDHLAEVAQHAIQKVYPGALATGVKWFAGESFYKYSEIAPSVFAFVGIRNEEEGMGAEHHNEKFDIDEDGLKYGVATATQFAIDLLG